MVAKTEAAKQRLQESFEARDPTKTYQAIVRGAAAPPEGIVDLDAPAPIVAEVGPSDANVRMFGPFFDRRLQALYAPPFKLIESSRGALELYGLDHVRVDSAGCQGVRPDIRPAFPYVEGQPLLVGVAESSLAGFEPFEMLLVLPELAGL